VTKEDLASLYRYAEFFIYPSFYEGFGIPVVDALKLHCPVITSNTSCLPEVVPQDYRFLVDPYSIEDIQTKMEKMLAFSLIERTHIIESNYLFAQKFSWKESAKKTIAIYNSL
jgi:glycosyltransferase involved in cell wall biosynthesis